MLCQLQKHDTDTSSPYSSDSDDELNLLKFFEQQKSSQNADEVVVTAAKEMGKELFAHLDPEERRDKLDSTVSPIPHQPLHYMSYFGLIVLTGSRTVLSSLTILVIVLSSMSSIRSITGKSMYVKLMNMDRIFYHSCVFTVWLNYYSLPHRQLMYHILNPVLDNRTVKSPKERCRLVCAETHDYVIIL